LDMCSVNYTNHLYGDEPLKRAQRRDARFINTGMLATLTGAVVSDGLTDYQIVSGVGGQYNFVAQAHELEGGRSIICLHSTRVKNQKVSSNIVWDYSHATIPRHLRDIVATEYGAADLRGLSDRDVIAKMLCIADSRFQPKLLKQAKDSGKLEADFEIPKAFRNNFPTTITDSLGTRQLAQDLPYYPMGSDFLPEEMTLAIGLKLLNQREGKIHGLLPLLADGWKNRNQARSHFQYELKRMGLEKPDGLLTRFYRLLVVGALSKIEASCRPLTRLFSEQADSNSAHKTDAENTAVTNSS